MARFDVYPNPETGDRTTVPYLLDVQNNFLDYVETRCVVPLHLSSRFSNRVRILNPEFNVAGKSVVMNTAAIGAIPANELRRSIANMAGEQADIIDALDTLFGGY